MPKTIFSNLFKQVALSRLDPLVKKSSQSGADLRLPVMGGTKFPTNDSLSYSKSLLKEHQNVARPKMERPTLKSVVPQYKQSTMPKIGASMNISEDPLVQYLRKEASGELEDNLGAMPLGAEETAVASETPDSNDLAGARDKEWKGYLQSKFDNTSGVKKKNLDKEHASSSGVVNRILEIK